MADNDDDEVVFVCNDWSHAGRLCKCYTCGRIERCTADLDFFCREDGDPLQCEDCFDSEIRAKGFIPYYTEKKKDKVFN